MEKKFIPTDSDTDQEGSSLVVPKTEEELKVKETGPDEDLTYSQEYYILHREEILANRRAKEMEAKFGDYSARLVKRPKKNFLWGFGTKMHDESDRDDSKFTYSRLICFA